MNKLFPFVLFFSLFQIITKYENNNELIIFWTFGISKLELINFIFRFSILLMLVQITLSSLIVPKSRDMARTFLKTSEVNFFGNFIKPKKFNDTIKNVTIYSERKDEQGNLHNLYLKKQTNLNNFEITYAKKGVFKEIDNIPILVLFDGATINSKDDEITNFSFSKSDFPINNTETNSFVVQQKTQELSSYNLLKCINFLISSKKNKADPRIINCIERNKNNIFKEIYKRFIVPFYILVLSLTPLFVTVLSKENSKYFRLKLITFLVGLFFIIFSETTIRLISESIIKNISISLLPFIFIITLYLIFLIQLKNKNFKK